MICLPLKTANSLVHGKLIESIGAYLGQCKQSFNEVKEEYLRWYFHFTMIEQLYSITDTVINLAYKPQ